MPWSGEVGIEPGLTTILACRDEELGAAAASEIPGAVVCRCDLTDSASIEATRAFVERECGRLDVLVNNARVCYNDATLYGKVPYTPFEEQAGITVRTNFFGSLEVTRALLHCFANRRRRASSTWRARQAGLRGSQALQDKVASPGLTVEALEACEAFVRDAEAGEHVAGWIGQCDALRRVQARPDRADAGARARRAEHHGERRRPGLVQDGPEFDAGPGVRRARRHDAGAACLRYPTNSSSAEGSTSRSRRSSGIIQG